MPIVRIDLIEGISEEYRARVGDIAYRTLVDVLTVPEHDRFQVFTKHRKDALPFDRDYLVEVPKENWSYGNGLAQYVSR